MPTTTPSATAAVERRTFDGAARERNRQRKQRVCEQVGQMPRRDARKDDRTQRVEQRRDDPSRPRSNAERREHRDATGGGEKLQSANPDREAGCRSKRCDRRDFDDDGVRLPGKRVALTHRTRIPQTDERVQPLPSQRPRQRPRPVLLKCGHGMRDDDRPNRSDAREREHAETGGGDVPASHEVFPA